MISALQNFEKFEELVFNILACTEPIKIDWKRGGRDRGRDINLLYNHQKNIYTVTVECKYYSKPVNISAIANSTNWAKVNRPDLIYFWVVPYLTPDAKDYLNSFASNYRINIDYEDAANIEIYERSLKQGTRLIYEKIMPRLLLHFEKSLEQKKGFETKKKLEYESSIAISDHSLVNRENELACLQGGSHFAYYLQGISGVGKSQIAKKIAQHFHKLGKSVFWHSVIGENDSDSQTKALLISLTDFFAMNCNNNELGNYFHVYGYGLTNNLLELVKELACKYQPIIFIDDIHKCRYENKVLLTLLMSLISKKICRIYCMGWYNVFPINIDIKDKIKYIHISGLSGIHLKELVYKTTGSYPSEDILSLLEKQYNGIPLYAVFAERLSSETINSGALPAPELVFQKYLRNLNTAEIDIINALAISRFPIRIESFKHQGMLAPLESLTDKKIVQIGGGMCFLHDNFKSMAKKTFHGVMVRDPVISVMKHESTVNVLFAIDIIIAYLNCFQFDNALKTFNHYFNKLFDCGTDLLLLDLIDRLLQKDCDFIDLSIKKISLLERIGELKQTQRLVEILDSSIDSENDNYQNWYYTKIRVTYFNCQFEKVVDEILLAINNHVPINSEEGIQLLFLLGRICYIHGDVFYALLIHLAAYKLSFAYNKMLVVKAIHRIAMIEEVLGFNQTALTTFINLLNLEIGLTKKRRAFILYRIAKCYYKLKEYKKALDYNEKSIKIKESLGHSRGLIFSYKLKAKIKLCTETNDAFRWADSAYKIAANMALDKEIVSSGIVLSQVLIKINEKQVASQLLSSLIPLCLKMKLQIRFREIVKLLKKCGTKENEIIHPKESLSLVGLKSKAMDDLIKELRSRLSTLQLIQLDDVIALKKPITPLLFDSLSTIFTS